MTTAPGQQRRAIRIRIGVALVLLSWLPIAQVAIWLTSASGDQADRVRAVIWGIQVAIGLIGVALAGRETIQIAKSVGWRKAPGVVWGLLRSPSAPISPLEGPTILSSNDRPDRPAAVYLVMQRNPMCEVEVSMASPWRAAGR